MPSEGGWESTKDPAAAQESLAQQSLVTQVKREFRKTVPYSEETPHYTQNKIGVSYHPPLARHDLPLPVPPATSPVFHPLAPFAPNAVIFWLSPEHAKRIPAPGPTGVAGSILTFKSPPPTGGHLQGHCETSPPTP